MFRPALAIALSLWMAVLACLMGCTIPSLASPASIIPPSLRQNSPAQSAADLLSGMPNMNDMPGCPHHSGGHAPATPSQPHPARGGPMSCCPVEVTVASKPHTVAPHISPASDFLPAPNFNLPAIPPLHSVKNLPPVLHSGRDTLLATRLLRI